MPEYNPKLLFVTTSILQDSLNSLSAFVTPHMTAQALVEFDSITATTTQSLGGEGTAHLLGMFTNPQLAQLIKDEYDATKTSSRLIIAIGFALKFLIRSVHACLDRDDDEPWVGFYQNVHSGLVHLNHNLKRAHEVVLFESFVVAIKNGVPAGFPFVIVNFMRKGLMSDSPNTHLHLFSRLKYALGISTPPTPLESEWLTALAYPLDLVAASNDIKHKNLNNKMEHPIFVELEDVMNAITHCRKYADGGTGLIHAIILFQLTTGCRMAEALLPTVKFEGVPSELRSEPLRYLKQIGRAKAKSADDFKQVRIIPLLGDMNQVDALKLRELIVKDFMMRLQVKHEWGDDDVKTKSQRELAGIINNMFAKQVGRQVRLLFPKQAAHCDKHSITMATHFLRAVWVNTHYTLERLNPKTPSRTLFFQQLLGHGDMNSAPYYESLTVTQRFELTPIPPPKKTAAKRKTKKEKELEKEKEREVEETPPPKAAEQPAKKKKPTPAKRPAPAPPPEEESETDDEEPLQARPAKKQKPAQSAQKRNQDALATVSLVDVYGERVAFPIRPLNGLNRLEIALTLMTSLMEHHIEPKQETFMLLGMDASKLSKKELGIFHEHFNAECDRVGIHEWGDSREPE